MTTTNETINGKEFIKTQSEYQIREVGTDRIYTDGIAYDLTDHPREYEELDILVENENDLVD